MTYGEVREFLAKHTEIVELSDESGGRAIVCPAWQGRVMTSTCGGLHGPSFGFINREFIAAGASDPHFNNYGGEERMWLSPEGGPFSLWFAPGAAQILDHWFTPRGLNEGPWKVVSAVGAAAGSPLCMTASMECRNASATQFQFEVTRAVRLLSSGDLQQILGASAAAQIAASGVKSVGFETDNRLTNCGDDMTREKGLVNIWMLSMLNSGPQTVAIVPYRRGSEAELGPVVKSDYFGVVPPQRLQTLPEAVLLRADGNYRAKIGISPSRIRNVLGSIDFQDGVLTLAEFSLPANPERELYMNNQWGGPLTEAYRGDVINSYNDGPPAPGKPGMGPFYEIESLSPARELKRGQTLSHRHRTIHIQADLATLASLAKEALGVELEKVRSAMLP